MINNNHIKIVMGFLGAINEDKKLKGFKYKTEEEMWATEKTFISIANKWNTIENFFVNNKVSIFIKEAFYSLFGVPYPEYLYNAEANDYVVRYTKGRTEDGKPMVEVSTTPELKYALDVSKMNYLKKRYMIYAINKTWKINSGEGEYRTKRILTYEKAE